MKVRDEFWRQGMDIPFGDHVRVPCGARVRTKVRCKAVRRSLKCSILLDLAIPSPMPSCRLHPVQVSAASSVSALQVAGASKRVPGAVAERPAVLDDALVKTYSVCSQRSCRPTGAGAWVLAQCQGLPQGRTRPTKLSPCRRGPFSIVAVDALTQQAILREDSCDCFPGFRTSCAS
jgi:hypothetical protein